MAQESIGNAAVQYIKAIGKPLNLKLEQSYTVEWLEWVATHKVRSKPSPESGGWVSIHVTTPESFNINTNICSIELCEMAKN